jgi:hypothetical protein
MESQRRLAMVRKEEAVAVTRASREKEGEERERRERGGRKVVHRFKLGLVTLTGLPRLSHAVCSGTTGGHAAHDG